jgi:hypothetical protein
VDAKENARMDPAAVRLEENRGLARERIFFMDGKGREGEKMKDEG